MAKQSLYQFIANDTAAQFVLVDGTSIDIRLADLTDDIKHQLMLHGLKQKVADAAAIPRDTETGRSASDEDKIAAMRAVAGRIVAGEWAARAGDGTAAPRGLLHKALERLYPNKSREAIAEFVAGLDKKAQSALRMDPRVAPIIAGLRAEGAKTNGIDTDELLGGLAGAYTPGVSVL